MYDQRQRQIVELISKERGFDLGKLKMPSFAPDANFSKKLRDEIDEITSKIEDFETFKIKNIQVMHLFQRKLNATENASTMVQSPRNGNQIPVGNMGKNNQ